MKTIFKKDDCYAEQQIIDLLFAGSTEATIETILTSEISIKDKRRFVYNNCDLTLEEKQKLSLLLAWESLSLFESMSPDDKRVRKYIEGIEKLIKGEITESDLEVLRRASNAAYADAYLTYVNGDPVDPSTYISRDLARIQKIQTILLNFVK